MSRAEAFREATRLVKDAGAGPYHHFPFVLLLAKWLYGEGDKP